MRGLVAGGATAAALYSVKPLTFFDPLGKPRLARWAVTRDDQIGDSVLVPWWLAAIAVGAAVDLFV